MEIARHFSITTGIIISCLAASSELSAATTVKYVASGTFASTPTSGTDGLRLAGEPFSIAIYVSESKTPTKTGTQNGSSYADYAPLDMTGTVTSALLPAPSNFTAYASAILTQEANGRDEFTLYAPVKIGGTVNVHAVILLPAGTLSSLNIAPFPTAHFIPAGSFLTYSTTTATTTLGLTGTISGSVYTPASTAPAMLHANGIRVITGHADGTQSVRPVGAEPANVSAASDKVMLQFYASGVDASSVHMQLAGQEVPVLFAGPSGHFEGLDEVVVEVPSSLRGAGEVDAVMTTAGQTADPVRVRIQ